MIALPVLTALLAQLFDLTLMTEVLMFFGLPPLYLFIRNPQIIKKTIIFSIIPWWPLTLVWEYLAYKDLTWYVQSNYRFFSDTLPLEDIPWGILFLVFGIAFWEYFFNESKLQKRLFPPQFKLLVTFLYLQLGVFILLYFFAPDILYLPYFFVWLGVVFCINPPILFMIKNPRVIPKLLKTSAYFFIPFSLMDFTATTQGEWRFPGEHYLGTINFFGYVMPYDEILFFWILCMPALASWYEFFADDGK